MARARQILEENNEGHHQMAELLIEKEVITSEDVERILGPRPWKSRGDEIIEANEKTVEKNEETAVEPTPKKRTSRKKAADAVAQAPETPVEDTPAAPQTDESESARDKQRISKG